MTCKKPGHLVPRTEFCRTPGQILRNASNRDFTKKTTINGIPKDDKKAQVNLTVLFDLMIMMVKNLNKPISVAAWVYGRYLAGIVGSNPAGNMAVC